MCPSYLTSAQNVQRGRPVRDRLEVARTMMWVRAACEMSKSSSQYQFEQRLGPSRRWAHYRKGSRTLVEKDGDGILALVDGVAPGSRALFKSPMWRALRRQPVTWQEAVTRLCDIDEMTNSLFRSHSSAKDHIALRAVTPQLLELVSECSSAGVLEALILLMWNAVQGQDTERRVAIGETYKMMLPELALHSDIAPLRSFLLPFVDRLMATPVVTVNQFFLEVVHHWTAIVPHPDESIFYECRMFGGANVSLER